MTVKLGTNPNTADGFHCAIEERGYNLGNWGKEVLSHPAFSSALEEAEVDLIIISTLELGFKDGATRADIYKRALERGFGLCPAEVGPRLRLGYPNQPNGEWLFIAMEPVASSNGDLGIFAVMHDIRGRCLTGINGCPDFFWDSDGLWVFLSSR